jgi:hypothetical protein
VKAERRKPWPRIQISVFHPDAFDRALAKDEYDSNLCASVGSPVLWSSNAGDLSQPLLAIDMKHSMPQQVAAKLLRQLADAIEQSDSLMCAPENRSGHYDAQIRSFIGPADGTEGLLGRTSRY